jgi:predicted membrane-bound mannosyltransferase
MARKPRYLADRAEADVRRTQEREELAQREFKLIGWRYWLVLAASVLVAMAIAVGVIYFYMRVRPI